MRYILHVHSHHLDSSQHCLASITVQHQQQIANSCHTAACHRLSKGRRGSEYGHALLEAFSVPEVTSMHLLPLTGSQSSLHQVTCSSLYLLIYSTLRQAKLDAILALTKMPEITSVHLLPRTGGQGNLHQVTMQQFVPADIFNYVPSQTRSMLCCTHCQSTHLHKHSYYEQYMSKSHLQQTILQYCMATKHCI